MEVEVNYDHPAFKRAEVVQVTIQLPHGKEVVFATISRVAADEFMLHPRNMLGGGFPIGTIVRIKGLSGGEYARKVIGAK